jgi:hypothetical protein
MLSRIIREIKEVDGSDPYWQRHSFQHRCRQWILRCFTEEIADDSVERNYRFFEEATELVQSLGMSAVECHRLVEYVYSRPIGDPQQESGGVSVTHAVLCCANGIDQAHEAEVELRRILQPEIMEKIRKKQAAKPRFLGR